MNTPELHVNELVASLTNTYKDRRPIIQRVCGKGSRRWRCHMSDEWQLYCGLLPDYLGARLHDLFMTCCKAEDDSDFRAPVPITESRLMHVKRYLEKNEQESKHRIANWETALRALPSESRAHVLGPGENSWLFRPRVSRSVNADPGTFMRLEADLAAWANSATLPLKKKSEMREPISASWAADLRRLMLCAATALLAREIITAEVSLHQLIKKDVFTAWHDGFEGGASIEKESIKAFIRIRKDLVADDEDVQFMRAQCTSEGNPHALTPQGTREIRSMLESPRKVELLPFALMQIASTNLLSAPGRLKVANVAAGIAGGLKYALRPGAVFELEHDENYHVLTKTFYERAAHGALPHFPHFEAVLKQRAEIRTVLGAATSARIMVDRRGSSMGVKECDQALSRTLDQFGLPAFAWQRLRDFTAVRMLRADLSALQTVADLLECPDPRLVLKRYDSFLPRAGAGSASGIGFRETGS